MTVIYIYNLWLFNVAIENGPFINDVPIKMVIFHGYVNQRVYHCTIYDAQQRINKMVSTTCSSFLPVL